MVRARNAEGSLKYDPDDIVNHRFNILMSYVAQLTFQALTNKRDLKIIVFHDSWMLRHTEMETAQVTVASSVILHVQVCLIPFTPGQASKEGLTGKLASYHDKSEQFKELLVSSPYLGTTWCLWVVLAWSVKYSSVVLATCSVWQFWLGDGVWCPFHGLLLIWFWRPVIRLIFASLYSVPSAIFST